MLYQIGTVTMDTRPLNVDDVDIRGRASIPRKPVIGSLRPVEFTGDDGMTITLRAIPVLMDSSKRECVTISAGNNRFRNAKRSSGQILPGKTGGLGGVEALNQMRAHGVAVPVVRGDGRALGWYAIDSVSEKHGDLLRNGVGFRVRYSISLIQVPGPAIGGIPRGTGIVSALVGLFNATG